MICFHPTANIHYYAEIDEQGLIATPANSSINELVVEAGRLSITHGGKSAVIRYGTNPGVRLR